MSENALVKDSIVKVPEVTTLARPIPELLLGARALIQETPEIQQVFRQSLAEHWPVEDLALNLEEPLQDKLDTSDPQQVVQVARYLADEYQQIGDQMLLISRETGKAIARLTDEHLWTPPPVPREDGRMVQPLPRLRPELEAALITFHYEKARDGQLVTEIAATLHPTDLLKQEGDPRMLSVTKGGRSHLVEQLHERLSDLLGQASGSVGQFLGHFELRETNPTLFRGQALTRTTAVTRIVTHVQDVKAMNLRFDRLGNLSARVANGWGREIAWALAVAAKQHLQPASKPYTALTPEEMHGVSLWVGDPSTVTALAQGVFSRRQVVLPVPNAPTMALLEHVGAIVIDDASYDCQSRELFNRWEVTAKVTYTLWVDWAQVRAFDLDKVPQVALPVRAVATG